MRRARGMSLLEVQVVTFLVMIVMGVFASLGHEYARILRFSDAKQQSLQAATTGLETMARELRSAVKISQPAAAGASAPSLRVQVVNPTDGSRLYPAVQPPRLPELDLNNPSHLITVEFQTAGNNLVRSVYNASNALVGKQMVAEGVNTIQCQWNANDTATLVLTVQEERIVRSLKQTVLLNEVL